MLGRSPTAVSAALGRTASIGRFNRSGRLIVAGRQGAGMAVLRLSPLLSGAVRGGLLGAVSPRLAAHCAGQPIMSSGSPANLLCLCTIKERLLSYVYI